MCGGVGESLTVFVRERLFKCMRERERERERESVTMCESESEREFLDCVKERVSE